MAYLAPADLPVLALSGGRSAELDTLDLLRRALSSDYTVFHGVHWSRDWRSIAVFGEADFKRNLDHARRLVFSGATRATVRLEMLVRGDNPAVRGFLQ